MRTATKFGCLRNVQALVFSAALMSLLCPCETAFAQRSTAVAEKLLKTELARYWRIAHAGGWIPISRGEDLRVGDRGERVMALRARLDVEDDVFHDGRDISDLFDADLMEAVEDFQASHGLTPDGVVGEATLAALNIPVRQRIAQIVVTLDSWKHMPKVLPARYLLLNAAKPQLRLVRNECVILVSPVKLGKNINPHHFAAGSISQVSINPYSKISVKPAGENPAMLPRTVKKTGASRLIADEECLWGGMDFEVRDGYPIILQQLCKHPSTADIAPELRDHSVEVDNPLELVDALLGADDGRMQTKLQDAVASNVQYTIHLPEPLPLYSAYFSVLADQYRPLQFCDGRAEF